MLQTPENSAFNKNRSRKLSGNNLTGGKNQGEYNTTAEPKQKPSTLLRPGKAGNLSVSKRITLMFTGKVKFRSHTYRFFLIKVCPEKKETGLNIIIGIVQKVYE